MKNAFQTYGRNLSHALNHGVGTDVWKGQGVAGFNPMQREAFGNINDLAGQSQDWMKQAMGGLGGIANGQNGITTGNSFAQLGNNVGPMASQKYLTDIAAGKRLEEGGNPYLDQMAAQTRDNSMEAGLASLGSTGRYGGGRTMSALGQGVANAENALRYQNYGDEANRQLQATGMIDSAQNSAFQQRLAALQGQTGVEGQNLNNQLSAYGQMPGMNQAMFAGANAQLAAGGMQQQMDQKQLDYRMQQFYNKNNAPFTQLGMAGAMIRGMPFGTANTMPGPSPFGSMMGGAMGGMSMGNSMFGPWGGMAGGALGGLGGMFG